MRFLIIGDGPEERQWARAISQSGAHSVAVAYPPSIEFPDAAPAHDLDEALAAVGVEAAVIGGPPELRAEALRRVAAEGLPAICLHPPGPNADPYYQVALAPRETGAVVVPDIPLRLHPALETIRRRLAEGRLGPIRVVRYEAVWPSNTDLLNHVLPRLVDGVRAFLGEVHSVTATGAPPRSQPVESLTVHLAGPQNRAGEIRLSCAKGSPEPARLVVACGEGMLTWEHEVTLTDASRLVERDSAGKQTVDELAAWDPWGAILDTLSAAASGRPAAPDLLDGTRAMEIAEAAVRSLERGRSIDLHFDEISEVSSFKAVMSSLGCGLVLLGVLLYIVSLIGMAMGFKAAAYLAWAIVPLLVIYVLLQLLRFAARPARR
jgi:myo-inositol 2-dehydrogenase/D-chiro-inositol 1-dehydrogenase